MNQQHAAPGRVVVLTGPTAVGKGTVVSRVRGTPGLWVSTSVTTRPARPGEVHGQHYYFIDEAEMDRLIADDGLLEWAEVHGAARYGTPRREVVEAVNQGLVVLLEIDLQGARQVRRTWPGATFVFLAPPSEDELVRRLQGRGTETPEQQRRRLRTAEAEIAAMGEFDHVVVNDDIDRAANELLSLLGLRSHPNT
ncbi:guanylate kinase [Enemella sp. A6]|uniref:guanylate kinase n=1 Tax=Enemella sp. A6 TaxID=3440152 RepID=UPI003EBF8586